MRAKNLPILLKHGDLINQIEVNIRYSQETLPPPMNSCEVSGFIRKPFRLGDLVHTIRNARSL